MKLIQILKEIKINTPGRSILFGIDESGRFTELVKLRGFKTAQEALDAINKILKEDHYLNEFTQLIKDPSYAYLASNGESTFVKDLSYFGRGNNGMYYTTEEDWGVVDWSPSFPY
jgi:hypothetical protein